MDLYARRVLGDASAGAPIVAGPFVRLAAERHLRDREAAASSSGHPGGWVFSEQAADVAITFYEDILRLPDTVDDEGFPKQFLLEPPLAFIVGSVDGWVGPDGYRRFREVYLEMGKGNAKTPLLAGFGLKGLTMDGETAAEIYAAAVTRDQARVMFRDAERMVDASPELQAIVSKTVNNLAYELSFFRPYSRDQGGKSGPRPHMALIDEVHEHPSPEVINKLKAGFKFRKNPLLALATNSGFDRTSICWHYHQHAERVLRGMVTDDRFFAYVCALDRNDDPFTDRSCWPKANPMLGITITEDYLIRQVENAKNIPAELNTVLRLNFCVWTQAQTRFLDMQKWQACAVTVPDAELVGARCYGGLDLGQSDDLCAFVRVWELEDGRVAVKCRFWLPESAREKFPHRPYQQWADEGLLVFTEGNTTDYDLVEREVSELCLESGVIECAYDKRFASQMALHLEGDGITMVDTPQGYQLNEALRRLSDLNVNEKLCHEGNQVLWWMASNAVVRHGMRGEIRLDKEKSSEKIDGIAALSMGISRMIVDPVDGPAEDPVLVTA